MSVRLINVRQPYHGPYYKVGDVVSIPTPGRKWWQWWKPKMSEYLLVADPNERRP